MDRNLLVGTWRLVSWESRDADDHIRHPFGCDAIGYLIYSAEGYMSTTIMRADRPPFVGGDILQGTDMEQARMAVTCIAYSGPYELQEGRVLHHVEASLFPNWVGSTQERRYELVGNRLTLRTAPLLQGGKQRRAHLVWERADRW